jgi:hypothetical protein
MGILTNALTQFETGVDLLAKAAGVNGSTIAAFDGAVAGLEGNLDNENPVVVAVSVGLAVGVVEAMSPALLASTVAAAVDVLAGEGTVAAAAGAIDIAIAQERARYRGGDFHRLRPDHHAGVVHL